MGCSSSAIAPDGENTKTVSIDVPKTDEVSKEHNKTNGHARALPQPSGDRQKTVTEKKLSKSNTAVDKNANKLSAMDQTPVPKSIAFDVSFGEENTNSPFRRKPARLLTLEPLNVTRLTAEQLEEKQRLADEKRERIRQKKINKSQKSSKRRKELIKAREFGMQQQMEQEKNAIEDHIKQADLKREQRLMEIKEKQRIREERAKRARERVLRMQNPDDEVEVEKDEQFNAASDESWVDNPNQHVKDAEEDIHKRIKQQTNLRPTASASTVDSYDAAFMRSNTHEKVMFDDAALGADDDFFGS